MENSSDKQKQAEPIVPLQQAPSHVAVIHSTAPEQQNTPESSNKKSLWKSIDFWIKISPSLILENKGATARDHLANERTFLAYLRTSLSVVTVGVAVTQLLKLNDPARDSLKLISAKALGAIFVAIGFMFILFGSARYFFSQSLLTKGLFPASRASVIFGSVVLLLTTIGAFIFTILL